MTALNFDPCLFDTDATTGSRPTLTNEMAARYLPRVQRHALRIARRLPAHVTRCASRGASPPTCNSVTS